MATILDEPLTEEERLRQEELLRQAVLQQQPPIPESVWQGSSTQDIDAFNARPAIITGAPGTVDSLQYEQELARARRGSGFLNADVNPLGEVLTPAYDPATDPRAIAAEREAVNFQRQQLYGQLLKGGSTAAEAYRFANSRYPDIKSAPGLIKAETALARRAPMQPEIQTIDGIRMMRTGPSTFARIPEPRAVATKPVPPLDAIASQKLLTGQITDARKDLERAKKELEGNPNDNEAARRALNYQNRLTELEKAFQVGSTNFMGAAFAPVRTSGPTANASPAPRPAQEVIRLVKGRRAVFDPQTKAFIKWVE